jgi:hypothetical protein
MKPQQDQGKQQNRVRFSPYDEILEIPHVNDLSQEEVDDVWMSRDGLQLIQTHCRSKVKMMEEMPNELDAIWCVRGLEQHTSRHSQNRTRTKLQIYNAVFELHKFQATQGLMVEELTAELCQKYSANSVLAAYKVGISDAKAAHC